MLRRSHLSKFERHIYNVKTHDRKDVVNLIEIDWSGAIILDDICISGVFFAQNAVLFQAINVLRIIPEARYHATDWLFNCAIARGFLAGMCLLRKWDPSLIYEARMDTILACPYPKAIWLLRRFLILPKILRNLSKNLQHGMFSNSKEDANRILIDGAKTNCLWKIRLAKKMGADVAEEAMLECSGITSAVKLIRELWNLTGYCFSLSMPPMPTYQPSGQAPIPTRIGGNDVAIRYTSPTISFASNG